MLNNLFKVFKQIIFLLFINILFFNHSNFAQYSCSETKGHDSLKITCYIDEIGKIYTKDMAQAIQLGEEAYVIAEKSSDINLMQKVEGWLGYLYGEKRELDKALYYNKKALNHRLKLDDKKMIVNSFNNLANNYSLLNEYDSSALMYQNALKYLKYVKDTVYQITVNSNLTNVYIKQGKMKEALENSIESYKTAQIIGDTSVMIVALKSYSLVLENAGQYEEALVKINELIHLSFLSKDKMNEMQALNMKANVLSILEKYDEAIEIFNIVLDFAEQNKIAQAISTVTMNIGVIYEKQKDYEKALIYFNKSLEINLKINSRNSTANVLRNIGQVYYNMKNFNKANEFFEKSINIHLQTGNLIELNSMYKKIAKSYFYSGKKNLSSDYFMKYIALNDSLQKEENNKQVRELSAKFENEKKELQIQNLQTQSQLDSIQKVKNEEEIILLASQKKAQRNTFIIGASGLSIVAILFIFIAINRKKTNQILFNQNHQINHQKEILEEKNQEITDSINYAFRIQSALLPSLKKVNEVIPNSFVLYKPKDIVAGDFYWMYEDNDNENKTIYIAAADCTGHGVPGAMVSVICNNGLNRSVKEFGLKETGKILDKTRELVVSEFEKSEEEVKDGMDISLVALQQVNRVRKESESDPDSYRDSSTHFVSHSVKWSGANNPIWIIRNGSNIIEEIKGDKQPIGNYINPKPFSTHQIELNKGDTFYLFTDGYADQFGGPQGKKFKYSSLKKLLISIQHKNMHEQKEILDKTFEDWKSDLEQVDDVCVIGVRL